MAITAESVEYWKNAELLREKAIVAHVERSLRELLVLVSQSVRSTSATSALTSLIGEAQRGAQTMQAELDHWEYK